VRLRDEPLIQIKKSQLLWFCHLTRMPRKDGRGESYWLHPRKSGLEDNFRPGSVIASPTLHGPISVWSQQMSQSLRNNMLYFESFQGYSQRDTMQRKSGYENEWVSETVYAITQI